MLMRVVYTNQMVQCVTMSMQETTYVKANMDPVSMPSIKIIYNMSIILLTIIMARTEVCPMVP